MSLYNMIHGVNPAAPVLLSILGINSSNIPRFRDCYWTGEHIAIYTRTSPRASRSTAKHGAASWSMPLQSMAPGTPYGSSASQS